MVSVGRSETTRKVLVRCGLLIDGTPGPARRDAALLVASGRIAGVYESGSNTPAYDEVDEVVDFSTKTVMPGMIDAHVHLVFNPLDDHQKVVDDLLAADERELTLRALRNAQAALAAGVTTLRDCGDKGFITLSLKRAIDAGVVVGPRLWVCGPPLTTTAGHCHFLGGEADTLDELVKSVRQHVKRGVDFIKVMATGGNMTAGSNGRRCQYGPSQLRTVARESHRLSKRVVAHTLGTEGIRAALRAGIGDLEHCTWLASTESGGLDFDPALVKEMVERGVYWGNTMSGIFRLHLSRTSPVSGELLDQWFGLFRAMYEAGVKMMISSDAGVRLTRFDEFALGVEAAVRFMGLPAARAIESVTRVPAEAMGLENEIGTLEVGKWADFVVLDGNPLEDVSRLRDVHAVFKAGAMVVRQGMLATGAHP